MRIISLFGLIFLSFNLWAQKPEESLDLIFDEARLEDCLEEIEQKTQLKFSFDSKLINSEEKISYRCVDRSLDKIIKDLFDSSIIGKRVGNHIVLIKNPNHVDKNEDYLEELHVFHGVVLSDNAKEPIPNASIYHLSTRQSFLTDADGQFTLTFPRRDFKHGLVVAKQSYVNEIIFLDPSKRQIQVKLALVDPEIEKLESIEVSSVDELNDYPLNLVPPEAILTSKNLSELNEVLPFQVSILPGIGSHWMTGGITQYYFSLNLLAGYSKGIRGMEVGGGLNICTNDVFGFQAAGIHNTVEGQGRGFQVAGISNRVLDGFSGFQAAGLVNKSTDFRGVQVSGIYNVLTDSIVGGQISGGINRVQQLNGIQVAGLYNKANRGRELIQVSGVHNTLESHFYGIQLAGISNYGQSLEGFQVAGLVNIAQDSIDGMQIAGLYNKTKVNRGVQLGLINVADYSDGLSIGLINVIKNGMKALELSTNEVFHAQLKYKQGTPSFYTIYSVGFRPNEAEFYGAGLGLGSSIKQWNRWSICLEGSVSYIHELQSNFDFNINYRLETLLAYRMGNKVSILAGPAVNYHHSSLKDSNGEFNSNIVSRPWFTLDNNRNIRQFWMGGSLAFQYLF